MRRSANNPKACKKHPHIQTILVLIIGVSLLCCNMMVTVNASAEVVIGDNDGKVKKLSRDEIMQQLNDASTGTITTSDSSDQERQPSTCNEIMAKAVVVASEERDNALKERDNAKDETQRANEKIEDLVLQLNKALEEAKHVTIEYEALKLMTDRLIDEVKVKAKKEIESKEKENELAIIAIKKEMEDWNATLTMQMEKVTIDTQKQIEDSNTNVTQLIAEMDKKMKHTKKEAQKEIDLTKAMSMNEIGNVKEEFEIKERKLLNETSLKISQLQKDADEKIQMMQKEVQNVTSAMEKLKESTKEEIKKMKDESETRVLEAYQIANERENAAMEQAYTIERNIQREIEQIKKESSKVVSDTYKAAEIEYEKVRMEAANEIDKIWKETQEAIDTKQREVDNLKDDFAKRRNKLQSQIDALNKQLETFNSTSVSLDHARKELDYWKAIGSNPTYVNTTLIVADTRSFANRTIITSLAKLQQSYDSAILKAETFIQPRLDLLRKLYNDHIQRNIDNYIVPFYKQKAIPFYNEEVVPFYREKVLPVMQTISEKYRKEFLPIISAKYTEHVMPHVKMLQDQATPKLEKMQKQIQSIHSGVKSHSQRLLKQSKITFEETLSILNRTVELNAGKTLKYLKENVPNKTPDSVLSYLTMVEEDASDAIKMTVKIISVLIIFYMRHFLFSLVWFTFCLTITVSWYIFKIPFRTVWFFCPLRLLCGNKSGKVKVNSDYQRNGKKMNGSGKCTGIKVEENSKNEDKPFLLKTKAE